ncbi:MAG: methionine synthase [Treponema sp.]|nr:methionine synthase [Treponema sp.]
MNTKERLDALAANRILVLDGAMGSMIQQYNLTEADFRGKRFPAHGTGLLGCSDVLCLTKPEVIRSIHEAYLKAGADIITTCSFGNATAVTLADYGLEDLAYEISHSAAAIARKAADRFSTPDKPRFVAGSMGPLTKSASISPDIQDPGKRGIYWDEMEAAYYDNARGLLDGGADILIIETIFDTLNAKAAIFAVSRLEAERGIAIPIMISASISDAAGRLLSGQTVEAFCVSALHAEPWSIGLNCSLGAGLLKKYIKNLAGFVPCLTSVHPNAGMPNEFGVYDDSPEIMAGCLETYMREGLLNIVGGCCGSTPSHIAAIAAIAAGYAPRPRPARTRKTFFAGLEPVQVDPRQGLIKMGERTNVAGSRQFLRLIQDARYRDALGIARDMIEQGADLINVCMDDPMLDAEASLTRFLTLALSDPDIARVPIMLDSSRWELIEAGLKLIPGKGIVNSISLKDGEEEFIRKARLVRRYGAAVMVMLFDERGQAATYERKIEVAGRAYRLLADDGFPPENIIFDGVVLTIATGIAEHDRYALDFVKACEWIRAHCPCAQVSGGIANLSFSFQGNEPVRNAMHAVLLKHAIDAGLSMAIVNPATMIPYDKINPSLRNAAEDLILCRKANAVECLLSLALQFHEKSGGVKAGRSADAGTWRSWDVEARIFHAMVKGIDDYIEADVLELRPRCGRSLEIIEGPLMKGMQEVGDRFGEGKMFLPQVIRSARVMQRGVTALQPFIEQEKMQGNAADARGKSSGEGKILLATVKGDVHDIGKNFVGVVLGCNGYEILDLGVMVPAERIIETAVQEQVRIIGLSGLITPSLDEMILTAHAMEQRGLTIPLIIGGATTSLAHTALRIAPEYSGPVVYVSDAGRSAEVVRALLSPADRPRFLEELDAAYRNAVKHHAQIQAKTELLSLEEARKNKVMIDWSQPPANPEPKTKGLLELQDYPLDRVIPYIDWAGFLHGWDMGKPIDGGNGKEEAQTKLREDAQAMLDRICAEKLLTLRGVLGFFPALSEGDDVLLYAADGDKENALARFCFLRSQRKKCAGGANPCLADFILPKEAADGSLGWLGLFALGAGFGIREAEEPQDGYGRLLLATLANALAEAFAEEVHLRVRREWWAYAPAENISIAETLQGKYAGLRPAIGYPVCPDHQDKRIAFKLLQAKERCGLELTESAMIVPAASVCGLYFANPKAYYFGLGSVGADQMQDWRKRKTL